MLRSEGGLDTSRSYVQGADLQGSAKKAVHRVWAAAVLQEPLSRCQLSLSCRKVPAKTRLSPASCPYNRSRQSALGPHKQQLSLPAGHQQCSRCFFLPVFGINCLQGGGESLTGVSSCRSRSTQGQTSAHPNSRFNACMHAAPIIAPALGYHFQAFQVYHHAILPCCHSEQLRGSCQESRASTDCSSSL